MLSQNQILNKILSTKNMDIITANNLNENYFFNYRAEFSFIQNHKKTYGAVPDKTTFVNTFPDFDLVDVNEPDSYLLEQIYKDYNQTYLANGYNNIRKLLENGKVEEAGNLTKQLAENQAIGKALTCVDLLKDTSRYDRYLERTQNKYDYYTTTGFPELDKIIGGIDRENENLVIYARTGQGKSQLLFKMGAAMAALGLNVGLYEGEMTADKVGYRVDAFLGHIGNRALNQGDLYVQREYKQYIDTLAGITKGSFKVFTPNNTPNGIVTVDTLKTFIERESLDVLLVDQYDLLDDVSNTKVKHEKIGNIAREIKRLQVDKHIPIISVCQQNREKNDSNEIDSTQVAGSDMIGRYATVLLALEQKYIETEKKIELTINIVKARDGGDHNKLKYYVDFDKGNFIYVPAEGDNIATEEDYEAIERSYEAVDQAPWEE